MAYDSVENDETSVGIQTTMVRPGNQMSKRGNDVADGGPIFSDQSDTASNGNQSNEMSLRKNYVYHLLDVALLMANASQLKTVMDVGESYRYYGMMITLIWSSIIVQIVLSLILAVICAYDRKLQKHKQSRPLGSSSCCNGRCDYPPCVYALDHLSVCLVIIVIVINTFITAFGFDISKKKNEK